MEVPIDMRTWITAISLSLVGCATGGAPRPAADDPLSYASALSGARWELPCHNRDPEAYKPKDVCKWDPALLAKGVSEDPWKLKIEEKKTFGGKPDVIYEVTLRFRGISEPKNYQGGQPVGEHFYVGGEEVRDNYNIYVLDVADPPQKYYLTRDERKTGHFTFKFDYTATVKIRGGAQVTLGTYDHNDESIANGEHHVVPGLPPAPQPYAGHFIQMDVVSVKPVPDLHAAR
jgi:hypothetical protein